MKKNNVKGKNKDELIDDIRDNKKLQMNARFNLDPQIQSKSTTRRLARKTVARAITKLNLEKKEKIIDDNK